MSKTVKINLSKLPISYSTNTNYRVDVEYGFVQEIGGNRDFSPAQLSATTITSFSEGPRIQSTIPALNSSTVMPSILVTYNRGYVETNTSSSLTNFYLYKSTATNTLVASIPTTSTRIIEFNTNTVEINLYGLITTTSTFYVTSDQGVVSDLFRFPSLSVIDNSQIKFTVSNFISLFRDQIGPSFPDGYMSGWTSPVTTTQFPVGTRVGSSQNYYAMSDAGGKVYVYNVSDNSVKWILNDPTPTPIVSNSETAIFGWSIALSDDYILIGNPYERFNYTVQDGQYRGAAYLFSMSTGQLLRTWSGGSENTALGWVVRLQGNNSFVSAFFQGSGDARQTNMYNNLNGSLIRTFSDSGGAGLAINSTHVYSTGVNATTQSIKGWRISDGVNTLNISQSFRPRAIAATENYIIGAAAGAFSGPVKVFSSTGTLVYDLINPDIFSSGGDNFGMCVDISNDYFVVSSASEEGNANYIDAGKVYVYSILDGKLKYIIENPQFERTMTNKFFGMSISLTEKRLYIAAQNQLYMFNLP